MSTRNRAGLALTMLLIGVTGSGCGSNAGDAFAAEPVAKIVSSSIADMKAATSLHMKGTVSNAGQQAAIDLSLDRSGNCVGSLGMGGATTEVLRVDGTEYLKGDDAFWKATVGSPLAAQVEKLLGDHWALLAATDQFKSLCDLSGLMSTLEQSEGTTYAKGERKSIDGVDAVEVVVTKPDRVSHTWVATEGKHYVLLSTQDGGGALTLSGYDDPIDAQTPAKNDVVDLSTLG